MDVLKRSTRSSHHVVMKLLSISNFTLRLGFQKLVPRENLALSSEVHTYYILRSMNHENYLQGRNHKFAKNL